MIRNLFFVNYWKYELKIIFFELAPFITLKKKEFSILQTKYITLRHQLLVDLFYNLTNKSWIVMCCIGMLNPPIGNGFKTGLSLISQANTICKVGLWTLWIRVPNHFTIWQYELWRTPTEIRYLHDSLVAYKMWWRKQSRCWVHVNHSHATTLVQHANATGLINSSWHQVSCRCYFDRFLVLECQTGQLNRIDTNT